MNYVGVVVAGVAVGAIGFVIARRPPAGPENRWKNTAALRQPNGAWCAHAVLSACVRQDGEVFIPAGEAKDTIMAYCDIRSKIPGASARTPSCIYEERGPKGNYRTNEVSGRLDSVTVLTRMIEGSGLELVPMGSLDAIYVRTPVE